MPASGLSPEDRDESDPPRTTSAPQENGKAFGLYKHNHKVEVTRSEGERTNYIIWRGLAKSEDY